MLLARAAALLSVTSPDKRKFTTWLRDELNRTLALPDNEAVQHLGQPPAPLASYLDLGLEANDPTFCPSLSMASPEGLHELGQRRLAYLKANADQLVPAAARGHEAIWVTVAELVAEALVDLTGQWPGRLVIVGDEQEGEEGGWGLRFFQTFAAMAVASLPRGVRPPKGGTYAKTWRSALKRLTAAGYGPASRAAEAP